MRIRLYIATSLDGFIAAPDGSVEWMEPFFDADYGFETFIGGIDCAVMGRKTYEQVLDFGDWPYPDHDVWVLSGSPISDLPPRAQAWTDSPADLVRHLRARADGGDCWLIGGGETLRAFEELGALDEYEIFVMPVLLGVGVPLFPGPFPESRLELRDVTAWENGVVRLVYGRTEPGTGRAPDDR